MGQQLLDQFPLTIDRLPLAYILMDANYRVLEWNSAAAKIFGYTREEAVGHDCLDLIVPLPVSDRVHDIIRRLRAGDMQAQSINDNRTKDGRIITCEWFNTPLTEADGRFAGVISLAQDVTDRRRAEQTLKEYSSRLQALSQRLVEVQEEERCRLARELHDGICQTLTCLSFAFESAASAPAATAGAKMGEARAVLERALNQIRQFSFDLRPALLDHFGLVPAVNTLLERYTATTGVCVNFTHAPLEGRLAPELETAAYRIVQEALTNVARHAQVREAAVRIWVDADTLEVQVEDQGVGFDPETVLGAGRFHGLAGIRERLQLLGGCLVLESGPGSGTHLLAVLPLTAHPERVIDEHFRRLGR